MKRLLFLLLLFSSLYADDLTIGTPEIWPIDCECCPCVDEPCGISFEPENIIVDLIDPLYEDGILSTEKGGVLRGPGIRIQARKITYTRKPDEEYPTFKVHCEDDLMIDYKGRILVGQSLDYDFITNTGILIDGRTSIPPWQLGGEQIYLHEQGSFTIYNGYIKTSEGKDEDWRILAPKITILKNQILSAHNISVRFSDIPVFWMPKIKIDLKNLGESPVAVRAAWGGFQGSKLSLRYQFLSWNEFDGYLRLDGYANRGLGGGIETEYTPLNEDVEFYTRNYYAHDISIFDPVKRDRYRFEGVYHQFLCDENISIDLLYDKVSDPDMAADYQAKDFDLMTAGRTELELRTQQEDWIADFFTKLRLNSFQTVNQELPSFLINYHPFEIGHTGIIAENMFQASYFDYVFGDDVIGAHDFHSARLEAHPSIYRPFFLGPVTATPRLGFVGIAYSNSPDGSAVGQAVGEFGLNVNTTLHNIYGRYKHVVEPYADYLYLTSPRVPVDHYFVFDIDDAYSQLNQLRVGTRQSLFAWSDCVITRPLFLDLFAYAFFDTKTIHPDIPKVYANFEWMPWDTLTFGIDTAWNFEEGLLDYYNFRTDWSLSTNLALSLEYRHRSRFDWRKADPWDFILESVRSEENLLFSPLSDRRDTALARLFYRFHPDWSIKFQIRHGWNRFFFDDQPTYTEYQADLGTILYNHMRLHFIYDKREFDHRFSISMKLDRGPKKWKRNKSIKID